MKQKEKRVLVTGASGFLGSHLSEELLEGGYEVGGIVYGDENNIANFKNNKNFTTLRTDITDRKKVFHILETFKPEVIFHTAAFIPRGNEEKNAPLLFEVNAFGTINLFDACRVLGIKNIIYSSSASIYGKVKKLPIKENCNPKPSSLYGLSKWMGEEGVKFYADMYHLNVVILRYAGIYGLRKNEGAVYNFFRNAINNQPLEILNDSTWDIVYVKDVVSANIKALEKIRKIKFEAINIGSGKETNIHFLAKKIIEICGSHSAIKINKVLPSFHFYVDINKAKNILGFKPTPLELGLKQYFQNLKEQQ